MHTTRRTFLGLGAAVLLDAVFQPPLARALAIDAPGPQGRDPADRLLALLASRDSAVRVGQRYLAQHPGEANADALLAGFLASAPGVRAALQTGSAAAIRQAVHMQYRDDYANGRTASIDGWICSATEVRICALAALARA